MFNRTAKKMLGTYHANCAFTIQFESDDEKCLPYGTDRTS